MTGWTGGQAAAEVRARVRELDDSRMRARARACLAMRCAETMTVTMTRAMGIARVFFPASVAFAREMEATRESRD